MRKGSQDGGDDSSITNSFDLEHKKPGPSILKATRRSIKRKTQSFSQESDDMVIEPLLKNDKEENKKCAKSTPTTNCHSKTDDGENYCAKDQSVQNDLHDIKATASVSISSNNIVISTIPNLIGFDSVSTSSNSHAVNTYLTKNDSEKRVSNGSHVTNIGYKTRTTFSTTSSSIALPSLQMSSTGQAPPVCVMKGYNPSPLIFTTAKIHADSKQTQPFQVSAIPIPSVSTNVNKQQIVTKPNSTHKPEDQPKLAINKAEIPENVVFNKKCDTSTASKYTTTTSSPVIKEFVTKTNNYVNIETKSCIKKEGEQKDGKETLAKETQSNSNKSQLLTSTNIPTSSENSIGSSEITNGLKELEKRGIDLNRNPIVKSTLESCNEENAGSKVDKIVTKTSIGYGEPDKSEVSKAKVFVQPLETEPTKAMTSFQPITTEPSKVSTTVSVQPITSETEKSLANVSVRPLKTEPSNVPITLVTVQPNKTGTSITPMTSNFVKSETSKKPSSFSVQAVKTEMFKAPVNTVSVQSIKTETSPTTLVSAKSFKSETAKSLAATTVQTAKSEQPQALANTVSVQQLKSETDVVNVKCKPSDINISKPIIKDATSKIPTATSTAKVRQNSVSTLISNARPRESVTIKTDKSATQTVTAIKMSPTALVKETDKLKLKANTQSKTDTTKTRSPSVTHENMPSVSNKGLDSATKRNSFASAKSVTTTDKLDNQDKPSKA